eukprot:1831838-Pleurochrysis_carterae.AAC.1
MRVDKAREPCLCDSGRRASERVLTTLLFGRGCTSMARCKIDPKRVSRACIAAWRLACSVVPCMLGCALHARLRLACS